MAAFKKKKNVPLNKASSTQKKIIDGKGRNNNSKKVVEKSASTEDKRVVWCFDHIDRGGSFGFTHSQEDFMHKEVLCNLIDYSSMTWAEIRDHTHDKSKSKHHRVSENSISPEAMKRIKHLKLEDYVDSIFSFALNNKLRIIGIRDGRFFIAVWYDPEHAFCQSRKSHT